MDKKHFSFLIFILISICTAGTPEGDAINVINYNRAYITGKVTLYNNPDNRDSMMPYIANVGLLKSKNDTLIFSVAYEKIPPQ